MPRLAVLILIVLGPAFCLYAASSPATQPAWAEAHRRKPAMTSAEARAFMKRLAQYVEANHLKKTEGSAQRGMVYEYFDVRRKGQVDQFVQGEALDTMHDGAWFGAALVAAYRATGDRYYYDLLTQYVLSFYCKVLNHGDTLFANARNDAPAEAHHYGKEHLLIPGEKGFCPYWWDDGGSVSLERRVKKKADAPMDCTDKLAGKPNSDYRLDGFSHGCSNHMAQDLGVLLMQSWLMLKDEKSDPAAGRLADEVAEAARNLHASRMRHHGFIPMVAAPLAAMRDAEARKRLPDPNSPRLWEPDNHYVKLFHTFKPDAQYRMPGFADDQEYLYYHGLAKTGGTLARPLAFKLIYDAYTIPRLYRAYCDDAPAPPGINVFDLHVYSVKNGKPVDYRSDRKGPRGNPRPVGSRLGPQNMVVTGWALQAMKAYPGIWEEAIPKNCLRIRYPDEDDGDLTHPIKSKAGEFGIGAGPEFLFLGGKLTRKRATLRLFRQFDAQGACLTVPLDWAKETVEGATDEKGHAIDIPSRMLGDSACIQLPTLADAEGVVPRPVSHARYSIQVDDEPPVNFCIVTPEARVLTALKRELAGGLRTWEAVFDEMGYIPSGIGTFQHFDHFSDSGGYAHLINAAAQWILYLDGRKDWEVHNVSR